MAGYSIPVVHRHREPVDWVRFPVPRMEIKLVVFDFWKTLAFTDFLKKNMTYKIYNDVKEISDIPYEKAILTDSARLSVENSGLKNFGEIFTPVETKSLKPDPKVFLTVINYFKLKPEECVMVGDDIERDLISAKELGMKTILIDRENKYPNYQGIKINSFKELKDTLAGLPA